jgi:hypothetical protein
MTEWKIIKHPHVTCGMFTLKHTPCKYIQGAVFAYPNWIYRCLCNKQVPQELVKHVHLLNKLLDL